MKIEFAGDTFILKHFAQYEHIRKSTDFNCACGYSCYRMNRFNMIGYASTNQGYMAVFECEECKELYRHHVGSNSRYSLDGFKQDAGLCLHLCGG